MSVLEGDADSRAQLTRSAQDIAERLSRSDAATLPGSGAAAGEAAPTAQQWEELLKQAVHNAQAVEIEEIVFGGEGLSPIEVAKRVKANANREGWDPGVLADRHLVPAHGGRGSAALRLAGYPDAGRRKAALGVAAGARWVGHAHRIFGCERQSRLVPIRVRRRIDLSFGIATPPRDTWLHNFRSFISGYSSRR